MTTLEIGDRITVKKGWSYHVYDPSESKTSDGKVRGTITAYHDHPGTLVFKLEDGRTASTAISGMEPVRGSSFKLWEKRLQTNDTLTRGQIRQFCNAIAAGAKGFVIGGHRTNLTPHECALLMDEFHERYHGYKLTPEHTEFGIEWLKGDRARAADLGVTPWMMDRFKEFRFVGVRVERINDTYGGARATMSPIYRVITLDGVHVDYSWSPWQRNAYA